MTEPPSVPQIVRQLLHDGWRVQMDTGPAGDIVLHATAPDGQTIGVDANRNHAPGLLLLLAERVTGRALPFARL